MIKLHPISLANITPNKNIQRQTNPLSTPAYDTFVRSTPAFKSNNEQKSSFTDWAVKTHFTQTELPRILLNKDYVIGSGYNHSTYKIPENDKYILRGPNYGIVKQFASQLDYADAKLVESEDKNLKINIGQRVADLMVKTNSGIFMVFEVLKKQEGNVLGVPPYSAISNEESGELRLNELNYEAQERKEQYAKSLEDVAKMPVEAYSQLISDLQEAAKAGYKFDHLNSNNILVDTKNKKFNLINMDKTKGDVNYGNVLYALTNINYFNTYASKSPLGQSTQREIKEAVNNTVDIIHKFMIAMKQNGVKFDKDSMSFEFHKLLRSYPMSCIAESNNINDKWAYFERNQTV